MNNRNKIEDKIHSVHFSILDYHNIFITTFYQFQSVLQKKILQCATLYRLSDI